MSCFYVLETGPLLVALFVGVFSHSVSYLFVLFVISFAVQRLSSLVGPH